MTRNQELELQAQIDFADYQFLEAKLAGDHPTAKRIQAEIDGLWNQWEVLLGQAVAAVQIMDGAR